MKKLLLATLATLASLLVCGIASGATDVSGKWSVAPFYFIFKQDGNKLSGTGGPSEKEQIVTFQNGVVDGDRITFQAGSLQVDLRLMGDEIRGEMKNGEDTLRVVLKRVEARPNGAQTPVAFDVASVKRLPPPVGGVRSSLKLDPPAYLLECQSEKADHTGLQREGFPTLRSGLAEFGDIRYCRYHAGGNLHGSGSTDAAESAGRTFPAQASPRNERSPDVCAGRGKGRVEDQGR